MPGVSSDSQRLTHRSSGSCVTMTPDCLPLIAATAVLDIPYGRLRRTPSLLTRPFSLLLFLSWPSTHSLSVSYLPYLSVCPSPHLITFALCLHPSQSLNMNSKVLQYRIKWKVNSVPERQKCRLALYRTADIS